MASFARACVASSLLALLALPACHDATAAPDATVALDATPAHDASVVPDIVPNLDAGALPFPQAVFRATHNSYSGDVDGMKGPIATQLDRGVRFIELDIHDDAYTTAHDFQLGHDTVGMYVDHAGGNPASNALHDWLATVATWSTAHPTHAPITVMFDLKSDLSGAGSYQAGDLAALNDEFAAAFGSQLMPAETLGASWPTIDALRGRVMVLLSGDPTTRLAYRRDLGTTPAVAIDAGGDVVEVHDSGAGMLWSWTGSLGGDGAVHWRRHTRIGAGRAPAVAVDDAGHVVEVDQVTGSGNALEARAGHVAADGSIAWSTAATFATGTLPSVRFVGAMVREVHVATGGGDEGWDGTVDGATGAVAWDAGSHGATTDPRFATASASTAAGASVAVSTAADGMSPANTLRYTTAAVAGGRVRFEQLAFVEYQDTDVAELAEGAWYYAAPSLDVAFITAARNAGRVARGWDFDSVLFRTTPLANYPATNTPYADWYVALMNGAGAVE